MTAKNCSLHEKGKEVFPSRLHFLVGLFYAVLLNFVCHTRSKDTPVFMQCEVSFVQKLERFKGP